MYNFKKIDDTSYTNIQTLYMESFGLKSSLSAIKRKYNTEFFRLKNVGILAEDEKNSPAAYYGVFPIVLLYDSKDYLVAQSGDTMTSPNHRKKGLFTKLAKETYQLSKELGIKMVFGFPNENSYPGFKNKLSWIFSGFMQKFTIKIPTLPLCEIASKYKSLEPVYEKFVKHRISKFKIKLHEDSIKCFGFSKTKGQIKKDLNFFKYKLENESCSLIKLNGFTLLIKPKKHLYIGTVGYIKKNQTQALLKTVKKLSKRLGCKKVIFTLSENHWLYEYLIEEIAPTKSLPIGFYLYNDTLNPEDIQFTLADYDTF